MRPGKTRLFALALIMAGWLGTTRAFADTLEDDLAKVQGVWERKTGHDIPGLVRATKEIHGSHEVVTFYGKEDKVLQAHEVDFELQRYGGAKVFTYSNWVATEGLNKGHKSAKPVSYIYRADDNTYTEAWGFMPGQENRAPLVMMWVRRKPLTDSMRQEQQSLQGTWRLVKEDKASLTATNVPGDEVMFSGDDFVGRRGTQVFIKGIVRFEPGLEPKRLDVIVTESPNGMWNGQTIHAAYEVKGPELTWCSGPPAAPRPQTLSVTPNSAQTLVVLRKAGS